MEEVQLSLSLPTYLNSTETKPCDEKHDRRVASSENIFEYVRNFQSLSSVQYGEMTLSLQEKQMGNLNIGLQKD